MKIDKIKKSKLDYKKKKATDDDDQLNEYEAKIEELEKHNRKLMEGN